MSGKSFFLSILILLDFSLCFGKVSISSRELPVLSQCFKTILETSEAGYVLYGHKPLCVIAYSQNDSHFEPRELHQLSTSICVAKKLLKNPFFHSENILFHFDERGEMLLIINKKNFLAVVRENHTLFQYILGPTITPESVFESIISSEHSFFEALKYDRALIGIVLGYGVQNSLYQSRFENICGDLIHTGDLPPFLPYVNLFPNDSQKEDLFFYERNFMTLWGKERKYLTPSHGYSSLHAELNDIEMKMQISSSKLQQSPNFIFGCLKDSKENVGLLSELEKTQEKIKKLLQSKTLLLDTLALISQDEVVVEQDAMEEEGSQVDLHLALAKLFRMGLKEHLSQYYSYFIKGLKGQVDESDLFGDFLFYPSTLTNLHQAKSNLEKANRHFQKVKKNRSFSPVLEPYLYYSVIKKGTGSLLQGQMDILVDYEILDPSDKPLNLAFHQRLDLRKVLPAFSHGLQGMKVGETRRLLIHPSLAYGVHTLLEKGIYLTAVVTLHHIYDSVQQELPPMHPTDLSYILDKTFHKKCEEKYKQALKLLGQQKREFLLSCPGIQLDLIEKAFQTPNANSSLTQEESEAINYFFWKVYSST